MEEAVLIIAFILCSAWGIWRGSKHAHRYSSRVWDTFRDFGPPLLVFYVFAQVVSWISANFFRNLPGR